MTADTPQPGPAVPRGDRLRTSLVIALVGAAVAASAFALWRFNTADRSGKSLPDAFKFDITAYTQVDEKLIAYREGSAIPLGLQAPRAVATGPDDRIYVAGDRAVAILAATGENAKSLAIGGEPTCLAVAGKEHPAPGTVYVGVGQRIEVVGPDGAATAVWDKGFDQKTVLTSIAVGEEDVFAADAGNRVVVRLNLRGEPVKRIGEPDSKLSAAGFVLPSPYFDVALQGDGLLRVANPGARRIETYTFEGGLLGQWGKASAEIDGFFGCCNPANFTVLPDGRFVTSEKGLSRIKIYTKAGQFESVVAGPQTLAPGEAVTEETREEHQVKVFDIAADSRGRILVLDAAARTVRVFERKDKT